MTMSFVNQSTVMFLRNCVNVIEINHKKELTPMQSKKIFIITFIYSSFVTVYVHFTNFVTFSLDYVLVVVLKNCEIEIL